MKAAWITMVAMEAMRIMRFWMNLKGWPTYLQADGLSVGHERSQAQVDVRGMI